VGRSLVASPRVRRLVLGPLAALAVVGVSTAPAPAATTRTSLTPAQIRAYNDSGAYARGLARGYKRATKALRKKLRRDPANPAVVLDIDETSLSNYDCLDEVDFALTGLVTCVVMSRSTVIKPARRFVARAQRRGVRVFFITGAPSALAASRLGNLRARGFGGSLTVIGKPPTDTNDSVVPYKSGARALLELAGYNILVNIGDQQSDLAGGHARRSVKLPNPIYVTT
jgi:predicted secreted acid phosphatase